MTPAASSRPAAAAETPEEIARKISYGAKWMRSDGRLGSAMWPDYAALADEIAAALRAAEERGAREMRAVLDAARCIRHWHDVEMPGGDGIIVSADAVRTLWSKIVEYDAVNPPAQD